MKEKLMDITFIIGIILVFITGMLTISLFSPFLQIQIIIYLTNLSHK